MTTIFRNLERKFSKKNIAEICNTQKLKPIPWPKKLFSNLLSIPQRSLLANKGQKTG